MNNCANVYSVMAWAAATCAQGFQPLLRQTDRQQGPSVSREERRQPSKLPDLQDRMATMLPEYARGERPPPQPRAHPHTHTHQDGYSLRRHTHTPRDGYSMCPQASNQPLAHIPTSLSLSPSLSLPPSP